MNEKTQLHFLMTCLFFFGHPEKTQLLYINSFCLKVKSNREITASLSSETEKLSPAGRTQVFNDAKKCPIFPSSNPRERCLHLSHFMFLISTFPEFKKKDMYFETNHKTWLLVNAQLTNI